MLVCRKRPFADYPHSSDTNPDDAFGFSFLKSKVTHLGEGLLLHWCCNLLTVSRTQMKKAIILNLLFPIAFIALTAAEKQ